MSSAKKGSPERLRPMTMKPMRVLASVRGSAMSPPRASKLRPASTKRVLV